MSGSKHCSPTTEKSAILRWQFRGNPTPRTAKASSDKTQEVYVKAARDFLVGKGIAKPVVKSLNSCESISTAITMTKFSPARPIIYPGRGESPSQAEAGNYSVRAPAPRGRWNGADQISRWRVLPQGKRVAKRPTAMKFLGSARSRW